MRSSSGRWLVPTVLLLVLLPVGGAIYNAWSSTRSERRPALSRSGSRSLGQVAKPLAFTTEPQSFVVTYRVERYDPDRVHVSTDQAEVRRPYDARITTTIDGKVTGVRVSRFGALVISTGEGPRSLVSPPSPASGDVRLLPTLSEALARKVVERREQREVVGRRCQVYRTGTTVMAGELAPVGSKGPGEYADICVDARGLLLEEVWMQSGHPLQRRVATALKLDVMLADSRFTLPGEQALTLDQGNGFLREIDPASAFEGSVYRLSEGPAGYHYRGRFVVSPPKLSPFKSPLDEDTAEQVSMVDVWDRGPDLVVLSQTIANNVVAIPDDVADGVAKPIDLPIGKAASILDLRSNEVRVVLPEDRFLRVTGTRPPDELVALIGSLRAETGTGLRFL